MSLISYTVRCSFREPSVAHEWIGWLKDEHLQDVLDGGATKATIYQMDGETLTYEIRYEFPGRDTFDIYERDFAPELRKQGLERFPLNLGLDYERTVGTTVGEHPQPEI